MRMSFLGVDSLVCRRLSEGGSGGVYKYPLVKTFKSSLLNAVFLGALGQGVLLSPVEERVPGASVSVIVGGFGHGSWSSRR